METLERAEENSVEIYISAGRPTPLITVLDDAGRLVNGCITFSGTYYFARNEDICPHATPMNDVEIVVGGVTRQRSSYVLVGTENLYIYQSDEKFRRVFVDMLQMKVFE